MRSSNRRILLYLLFACVVGVFVVRALFDRTREFRAQAQAGQPIVGAIEAFKKESGHYPASLADLVPKYLPAPPDVPDRTNHKFRGWEYRTVTNGIAVSYSLIYYMGRGGVEYDPPRWFGNDEGHRTILLRNERSTNG
jgi:hypothetical protein